VILSKFKRGLIAASIVSLTACGGGASDGGTDQSAARVVTGGPAVQEPAAPIVPEPIRETRKVSGAAAPAKLMAETSSGVAPAAASHFLAQATFGPTAASINALGSQSKSEWIDAQFLKPQTLHRTYVQQVIPTLPAGTSLNQDLVFETFWKQAVTADDQLRQRVTFALSEIFVISTVDGNLTNRPIGVASYYDMLAQYSFGNFRDLLQGVATHPMMGLYLTYIRNQKENGMRLPDENFAREIMQLMSIGLYQLNSDGTQKLAGGLPIPTYTRADVAGLAKVFTGWSWSGPDKTTFRFDGGAPDPARDWTPMQNYPTRHSTSPKSFLGVSISGATTGEADMKLALDTLFNHPNVGPFIGRQLIQRLVSSNPSPAYVGRVAAAFANNGAGVRGDMRAVIRAVLLDAEAADTGNSKKLREPVLRMANWLRAFNAKSVSGRYKLRWLDDTLNAIGQNPLSSPSVFNYFRPGYTPPNTALSSAGMASPEMQITGEPSVVGYLNYMQRAIPLGGGDTFDMQPDYSAELALAPQPALLVDRVNLLLLGGGMSTTLRTQILGALNAIIQPESNGSNAEQISTARKNRVYMAIFLTIASPEYIAQR